MLPLRILITGRTAGPDLLPLMEFLGKPECVGRMDVVP